MRRRLLIAAMFLLAGLSECIGCASPAPVRPYSTWQPATDSGSGHWRRAQPLPEGVVRCLARTGASVLGAWYRDKELLVVLDLQESYPIREGWTLTCGWGDFAGEASAGIYFERVDGRSAIAVICLPKPPLPAFPRTRAERYVGVRSY